MKKMVRNLTLMLLAFVLAITVVPMDSLAVAPSSAKSVTASSAYGAMSIKGDATDTLTPHNLTGNMCAINMSYSYTTTSAYVLSSSNYSADYGRVIPITVNKPGTLVSTIYAVEYKSGSSYATHEIYYDAACSNKLGYIGGPNANSSISRAIEIPSAGTYYLLVNSGYISHDDNKGAAGEDKFSATFMYYAEAPTKTLKNGETFETYNNDTSASLWFAYKATADGYITLQYATGENYDTNGSVTLYNSSKKEISRQTYFDLEDADEKINVFGVKKGKTYYIKAEYVYGNFGIRCTQKAIKEKSGKNKKKAVVVKKNKKIQGTMIAGENKADWYKIKLTKKQVLKIIASGSSSSNIWGGIQFTLYYANGKQYASPFSFVEGNTYTKKFGTVEQWTNKPLKLNKGTYYIKISKEDQLDSGYYTLKWK